MSLETSLAITPVNKRTRKPKEYVKWGSPGVYLAAIILVTVCITPVLYVIIGGFRDNAQFTTDPAGFPNPWNPANYINVLTGSNFWPALINSVVVGLGTALGTVALGLMASYVMARYNFTGKTQMYSLFAAGLMFPATVAITPLYIMVRALGLTNTHIGLILPQIAFALPTTIIILVPFLKAIPMELEEAAAIDGTGRLGFFFRMVLPLSLPGVITTGILAFVGSWNGYLLPLFLLGSDKYTLPLAVQNAATSQYASDAAMILAYTSLSMLPALIFFSLFERRIVGGLTGAVKG